MAVSVDWDVIEGVEDLDKVFKKAIAKADEADEAEIRQQWSESKAQFWERRAERAALDVAKRDALDKYPLAKDFAEDIKGNSPGEIEAQAKRFHERMEKATADAAKAKADAEAQVAEAQQQAREQYGSPAAGGGGTPARPPAEGWDASDQFIRGRLARGEGLGDARGKIELGKWIGPRIAQAAEASRTNPSYRSFVPDKDRTLSDDRKSAASRGYKPEKR